ncbi:hypothetical protein BDSB_19360 [Burkholderia dolosa PC543]|nr:hypothetical protein BDSB_19360 [Burkholderia dolosa PC543]
MTSARRSRHDEKFGSRRMHRAGARSQLPAGACDPRRRSGDAFRHTYHRAVMALK